MGKSGLLTFVAHEQNELLQGDIAQFEQYSEQGDFFSTGSHSYRVSGS